MSTFKIDFDRLLLLLLPTMLRKQLVYVFLRAALAPLRTVYARFSTKRKDTLFLLKYDTSKRNIEIALQKKFNDDGVFIENVWRDNSLYLDFYIEDYMGDTYEPQVEPAYLDQYIDFYLDEQIATDDFIIKVPELTYITSAQDIYNFAGYFVLPGFKYSVQRF